MRGFRFYVFTVAGDSPCPLDAFLGDGGRAHGFRGCVVQEAAEGLVTKVLVFAGEKNELVPGYIHCL